MHVCVCVFACAHVCALRTYIHKQDIYWCVVYVYYTYYLFYHFIATRWKYFRKQVYNKDSSQSSGLEIVADDYFLFIYILFTVHTGQMQQTVICRLFRAYIENMWYLEHINIISTVKIAFYELGVYEVFFFYMCRFV